MRDKDFIDNCIRRLCNMHAGYCSPTCLRSQIRKANRKIVRFDELQKLGIKGVIQGDFPPSILMIKCKNLGFIENCLFQSKRQE